MKSIFKWCSTVVLGIVLAGCAGMGMNQQQTYEVQQGVIEQISLVPLTHSDQLGVGAILGGAAGAGLGSLIGAGTGRDVAMAVGAIAGAVAGKYGENRYDGNQQGQQVVVRLNSGVLVVVTQPYEANIYKGQRVYIEGSGSSARIAPM
ncbi:MULTISPECIES: glycine zipper 2TM domain-containing protein [Deefgea]|uniref:Glycine zipper 2TM domain-containing protein n=1 Tax=Deefgea piscis TaxID=2739061 RepID=A0A6M8SQ11_9NEIS|nr:MULTISPECIES: glycine zipper 2TM domain-containing protein [Deefgea]MBM5575192.1 glycine zipper 2TM domain-containing protein [Deefgea sp. CFH1-16]QKJ65336.1 glycine zipper 2TM domain-containing protein [Deefgea piscis]